MTYKSFMSQIKSTTRLPWEYGHHSLLLHAPGHLNLPLLSIVKTDGRLSTLHIWAML